MVSPTVREAVAQDAESLAQFNIAMARETEGKQLDPATVAAGVQNLLANPDEGFYLVAEKEGQVIGALMVTFEWSDWRNGCFWWLQSVYVEPSHRRSGTFSVLYKSLKSMAQSAPQVCGLRLYVDNDNQIAQLTYRHLGMKDAGYKVFETEFEVVEA